MKGKTVLVLGALFLLFSGTCPGYGENTTEPDNDLVITNVTIIDVNKEAILENQQIIIDDGHIISVRPQPNPPTTGNKIIDGSGLVALPGFINTHTHLWQHVAKGFYPEGNLQQWVRIYRYAHYFTGQELYDTIKAASCQAFLSGITTVSDFASMNFSEFALEENLRALKDTGMDGMTRLHHLARQLLACDKQKGDKKKLTKEEVALLKDLLKKPTISPVPVLEKLGALPGFVSVHSVWLTQDDMDIYKKHKVYISHNPESNMYLSSGIAPILRYMQEKIPVTIGTDGAASNDGINFFSAMRAYWNLQKYVSWIPRLRRKSRHGKFLRQPR